MKQILNFTLPPYRGVSPWRRISLALLQPTLSDAGRQVGEHKLMRHARDLRRLLPARAASGHAAAPPSVAKNLRRAMWLAM
jgi:hypothetical protein